MKKGIDQTIAWVLAVMLGLVLYGGGTYAFMKAGSKKVESKESHEEHGGTHELSAKSPSKVKADDVESEGHGSDHGAKEDKRHDSNAHEAEPKEHH